MKKIILMTLLALILFSCGSEECIDSTCPDFVPAHVGEYTGTTLVYFDCEDPDDNNRVLSANSDQEYCLDQTSERFCWKVVINLHIDETFDLTFYDSDYSEGIAEKSTETFSGSYEIDGLKIELCESLTDCIGITIDEDYSNLTWTIQGNTCKRTYNLKKG